MAFQTSQTTSGVESRMTQLSELYAQYSAQGTIPWFAARIARHVDSGLIVEDT